VESDPIGLAAGISTFSNVGGRPLGFTDPFGLCNRANLRGFPPALQDEMCKGLDEADQQLAKCPSKSRTPCFDPRNCVDSSDIAEIRGSLATVTWFFTGDESFFVPETLKACAIRNNSSTAQILPSAFKGKCGCPLSSLIAHEGAHTTKSRPPHIPWESWSEEGYCQNVESLCFGCIRPPVASFTPKSR